MYFDKINNKTFCQILFNVFNGVWRQPIEHTKTFFWLDV